MEAQLQRPSHSHEDDRTHSEVGGEKKSVLKKVKDKAKKMKESIKKHGPGHHQHDEDEEDHKVDGAPVCESTVVKSVTLPNKNPSEDSHHSPDTRPPTTEKRSDRTEKQVNSGSNNPGNPQLKARGQRDSTWATYAAVADKAISAKKYLCEKLKPGEEDKALSEVITIALQKKKPPKRGKVTVSKEVAERLGLEQQNKREGEDAVAAGEESRGDGVAEKLQNAVSSWLGKSNGIQTAQDSISHAFVSDAAGGHGPMSNQPHPH